MSFSKTVLVGGGTGFVGQRLCDLLWFKGYKPVKISRSSGPNTMVWWEITSRGLPSSVRAVVNCTGQPFMSPTDRWTKSFKDEVVSSRVCSTRALAASINCTREKPDVYVVITGVGAYEPSETRIYDECSPTTCNNFFSELTKCIEENAQVDDPVRLVIIRSGVVLGRWGGMVKNVYRPFYLGLGGPLGNGKQFLPWIHIDDLVRLIVFAIENEHVSGILNGVAPQIISNQDFAKAFGRAMWRPAAISVPKKALDLLYSPERAMIILEGQCVEPKRVLDYGFEFKYKTISEACKEMARFFYKKPEFE